MEKACKCKDQSVLIIHTHDYILFQNPLGAVIEHCMNKYGPNAKIYVADFTAISSEFSFANLQKSGFVSNRPLDVHEKAGRITVLNFTSTVRKLRVVPESREQAILSEMFSFFLSDSVPNTLIAKCYKNHLKKIYNSIFSQTLILCEQMHFCVGYSLNGRHPPGAAASTALSSSGVELFFWEAGEGKDAAFICHHQPQDHAAILKEFSTLGITEVERRQARKWGLDRVESALLPRSTQSSCSKRAGFENPEEKNGIKIAFFSSSKDEFWSLGSLFPPKLWKSQYEGLSELLSTLGEGVDSVTIRLHPNLANKSLRMVRSEISELREMAKSHKVEIVAPTANINSYQLAADSDLVVVANSTMGVEAILMGKNVIHLENSIYAASSRATLFSPKSSESDLRNLLRTENHRNQVIAEKEIALMARHRNHIASLGTLDTSSVSKLQQAQGLNGIIGAWALVRFLVHKRNSLLSKMYLRLVFPSGTRTGS